MGGFERLDDPGRRHNEALVAGNKFQAKSSICMHALAVEETMYRQSLSLAQATFVRTVVGASLVNLRPTIKRRHNGVR